MARIPADSSDTFPAGLGVLTMTDKKHNWTDEQKKLLLECIEGKWTLLVEKPGADEPECNLCELYNPDTGGDEVNCEGCPVATYREETDCWDTPYYDFRDNLMRDLDYVSGLSGVEKAAGMAALKKLATAERDFLREVLEAGA